jgi:hypothetical protein
MISRDAFMLALLVCLAIVPSVQAQASGITSILGLKYPSQATLQNGVAQATVTFSVYYNYYRNPQGYLVFGIADQSASEYVKGTATATPVPCQPITETEYANAALCAVVPASSSGSESASFILTFNSPGQHSLSVLTFVWDSRNLLSGNVATGSSNSRNFEITVTGQVQTSTSSATITNFTNTQFPSQVPPTGSWWTFKGSWSRLSTGSGSWKGTLTETGTYSTKILVTSMNPDAIALSRQDDEQWTCAATDTWSCSSASGTESHTYQYTISLNTFKVTSVGGETTNDLVGHPTYIMINIGQLTEGGKVAQYWWVPSSDGKGDNIVDADFSVSTQTADIKGAPMEAWLLSYTGDVIGWYNNDDGVYSKGPATQTDLHDPLYGIEVAYSFKSNTNGVEVGGTGTWTEVYSEEYQLQDTTLSFTAPVTTSVQTSTTQTSPLSFTTPATTSGQTTTTAMTTQTSPLDSTWLYVIAGLIAVVIVLSILAMRRRRVAPSQPSQSASPAVTGSPAAAAAEKFCINCGSRIPAKVAFCPRCGEKQS